MFTTHRRTKIIALAVPPLLAALAVGAWLGPLAPRTPAQRATAATDLLAAVHVSTTLTGSSLLATQAVADFGVGNSVGLVTVRIVEELAIEAQIVSDRDVTLATAPRFCLVGPFAAPDDAGLSDRCWGEPDLGESMADRLPRDPGGRWLLPAGVRTDIAVTIHRGGVRCDYPPGAWLLEIALDPLIDGTAMGPQYLTSVSIPVPWASPGPLRLDRTARYCGLANGPFLEQGEPAVGP